MTMINNGTRANAVEGGETAAIGQASDVMLEFLTATYLEASEEERVAVRALAERLGITPPAVSRTAQRLVRRGLLRREGACGLVLTEEGRRMALLAIRKRRVFEVFLVRMLGYTWDEVYPIAAAASNHLDEALVDRMDAALGQPKRCPHGDPIPTRDGEIERVQAVKLCELEENRDGVISRVASHDPEMLSYLGTLHLTPGQPICLVSRAPFGGPLRVRLRRAGNGFDDEHVIGAALAGKIWIEQVNR
ncbi:MAG: metal-dependent transcriptional regulator [Chloroflexi bacterium]|nr:metal-dependent transcriptional regulator [Chloroflexota bacterium]